MKVLIIDCPVKKHTTSTGFMPLKKHESYEIIRVCEMKEVQRILRNEQIYAIVLYRRELGRHDQSMLRMISDQYPEMKVIVSICPKPNIEHIYLSQGKYTSEIEVATI